VKNGRIQLYEWNAAVREVGPAWSSLVAAGGYNPSLHPDWLGITLEVWGLRRNAAVAVFREGGTEAILPFLSRRTNILGVPVRCLDLCSNVLSYHAEIVASGDVERVLAAVLADRNLPAWDAVRLTNLPREGRTATAARAIDRHAISGISVRPGERSPYVPITLPWQQYLATRPKKLRSNITRCDRTMKQAGETGMRWYGAGDDMQQLLNEILAIEAISWKREAGIAIERGTPQGAYYERLLPWLSEHGMLANVLYVREQPVAYALCASWQGWVGQLKTSFDGALRDAGSRVIQTSLQKAFEAGAKEYDFLGDAAFHKLRWTDSIRTHEDIWLFSPALRGRAVRGLKHLTDRAHAWREARAQHSKETEAE
jgi:CelD/BcsL family acetyltransferase involved in cellulose biosynthesis